MSYYGTTTIEKFREQVIAVAPNYKIYHSDFHGCMSIDARIKGRVYSRVCMEPCFLVDLAGTMEYIVRSVKDDFINVATSLVFLDCWPIRLVTETKNTKKMGAYERFSLVYFPKYAPHYTIHHDKSTLQITIQLDIYGSTFRTEFKHDFYVNPYIYQMCILARKVKAIFPGVTVKDVAIGDGYIMPVVYESSILIDSNF